MDRPSFSIDWKSFGAYIHTASIYIQQIWHIQKEISSRLKCAITVISGLETQDGMPSDMQYMVSLISLLTIGIQPPILLHSAIKQMLYQNTGFLNHMMALDEIDPVLETRLQQMDLLPCDSELERV